MNEGQNILFNYFSIYYITFSFLNRTCLINTVQINDALSDFRSGKWLGTCKHLGKTLNEEQCLHFEYFHGKFNSILFLFLTLNFVNGILM